MIFLVNNDIAAARTLMLKMAKQAKPGAIIPCTDEEFNCFKSGAFEPIQLSSENAKLVEVDPDKTYLYFADAQKTNLFDLEGCIKSRNLNIGIVRVED